MIKIKGRFLVGQLERASLWGLWIFPLAYVIGLWFASPPGPLQSADSPSYIHFFPIRTAAYPIFLKVVNLLFGDLSLLPHLQLAAFGAAAMYFGLTLRNFLGKSWPAVLMLLGVIGNPYLIYFHNAVLTESLFCSLALLFLTLLLNHLLHGGWRYLSWMGAVVGLMIATRPVGYAWVALLAFVTMVAWRKGAAIRTLLVQAAAWTAPLILVMGFEGMVYHQFHETRQSLLPRHIFARGALVEACAGPECNGLQGRDAQNVNRFIQSDLAELRSFIRNLDSTFLVHQFLSSYECFIQYEYLTRFPERSGLPQPTPELLVEVGKYRLLENPSEALGLIWYHYTELWNRSPRTHPWMVDRFNVITQGDPPPPFSEYLPEFNQPLQPRGYTLIARLVIQTFGIVTLIAALLALGLVIPWRVPARIEAAMYFGLIVHGYFLLVSITGLGFLRYVFPVWSYMVVVAGIVGLEILDRIIARKVCATSI